MRVALPFFSLNYAPFYMILWKPKCSSQIRLQDFRNFNISKTNWVMFVFFHVIFVEYDQACPPMSNVFGNNKAPISPKYWLILFTFWICIEAKVLCSYSWLWSSMLKVLRNNKLPISLKCVEWFVDFLDVVIYFSLCILSSYKSMLFSGGIIWHGL